MKQKWILISLSVIFFLTALTFYANRVIFPTLIKKIAVEQAQNFFKRKVEIESLHFNWLKGVIVNKIKIYQKDSSDEVLAQAEKISLAVIFIPGLKQHKLIIPSINVEAPSFHVIQGADGQWNFSDLLIPPVVKTDEKPLPVTVSVTGVHIFNGKVRLDAIGPGGLWTELLDQINLKIGLSYQGINFNGSLSLPQKQGFISIDGAYQPLSKFLKSSIKIQNIKPLDYLALTPIKLPFKLDGGAIKELNAQIDYSPQEISAQGNLSLSQSSITLDEGQTIKSDINIDSFAVNLDKNNNPKVTGSLDLMNVTASMDKAGVQGSLSIKNLSCALNQVEQTLDAQIQGASKDLNVALQGQGKLTAPLDFEMHVLCPLKYPTKIKYNGSLNIQNASFEGLPLGTISSINLAANVQTDSADIKNLSLTLLDTPIHATGHVINFLKPLLNMQIESDSFDLSKIKAVAPDLLKPYGLTVDGETSFKLTFEGLATDPLNGKVQALAVLKNANVNSSVLQQKFQNISGTLTADGHSLSWKDFTLTLWGSPLTSKGDLNDFKNPKINTSLTWQDLELNAQINKTDNLIDINNVSGHYLSTLFHASGTVDLSNKNPLLDIKSDLKFKLEDVTDPLYNLLLLAPPAIKEALRPLKLSGLVTLNSSIKGTPSDFRSLTLTANAQSDLVSIAGFKFNNFNVDVSQEEGKLKKFNITSKLYDGDLNIVTTADLTDPAMPFETALHADNVNIENLKNDTGAKDEDLRGFLAVTAMLNGDLKDILKVTGNGALNVSQGYLMEKKFSSIFMIPALNNLIFTDATANFTIADQKVSTENFALKSQGATLNGKGYIAFDQKLQFELHPEFNTDTISQSDSMRKGTSALIALAAGTYLTIDVTGTLEKPQVQIIKKPTELLKKTGELIKDNVGQILQGLFQ